MVKVVGADYLKGYHLPLADVLLTNIKSLFLSRGRSRSSPLKQQYFLDQQC